MFKKKAAFLLPLLVSACAGIPPKNWGIANIYEKAGYEGIVRDDSEIYLADDKVCEKQVYSTGVDVDGEIIRDRARLNYLFLDVYKGKFSTIGDPKDARTPGENTVRKLSSVVNSPKYIIDIFRLDKEQKTCMRENMGYKPAGFIRIDKETRQEMKCIESKPHDICRLAKESELTKEPNLRSIIGK
jgi:hypothetical protein